MTYGQVAAASAVPTAAVVVLPNTGSASTYITAAIAVAVGLLTWGVLYARSR